LLGSTMGNDHEFDEMLTFVSTHQIRPLIDSIRPFSKIVDSFADITKPNKVGKIVFQI
jgi:zinc-binding alcohol dehydrogenase/oxidoreductase